jgi:uncharacterized protein
VSATDEAWRDLLELHTRVDTLVTELTRRHADRLACARGCSDCCLDELTVFEVEAERLRREHPEVLTEIPHPEGACAFLDAEGACRAYSARPFVCRTQGLPLLWFDEDSEGEIEEHREICELNVAGEALEGLEFDELWILGPFEQELSLLQERFSGGGQERVALRAIFGKGRQG